MSEAFASRTVRMRLRWFSFHEGCFLTGEVLGLFRTGDMGVRGGPTTTSGRSSSLCLAESNTFLFLVAIFSQTPL